MLDRVTDHRRLQMCRRGRDAYVGRVGIELDRLAVDGAVAEHGHHHRMASGKTDDLNRPDGCRLGAWPDDDSGVLSDLSKQVGGLMEQLLEPPVRGVEKGAHPL